MYSPRIKLVGGEKIKKFYTAMNEAVFFYSVGLNDEVLKEFIKEVTGMEVYSVELKNSKLLKDYMKTREKTIDLLVLTDIGYINVEINNNNYSWLNDRNYSYSCKVLSNAVYKSQYYDVVPKVIQINLNHLGQTSKGIARYMMRSDNTEGFDEIFTDKIEIYVVNIDFFKKMVYNDNKKLIKENYLLCALDLPKEKIDDISEGNEILMNFRESLEKINDDEDFVKWDYEAEAIRIENTIRKNSMEEGLQKGLEKGLKQGLKQGIKQGIEQGIEQGEKNKQIEIARNLVKQSVALDIISLATGLTIEEIDNL